MEKYCKTNTKERIKKEVKTFKGNNNCFSNKKIRHNLEGSIKEFGIEVVESDMEQFKEPEEILAYTILEKGSNTPKIYINTDLTKQEKRFVLSYELWNIVLRWDISEDLKAKTLKSKIKRYHILKEGKIDDKIGYFVEEFLRINNK